MAAIGPISAGRATHGAHGRARRGPCAIRWAGLAALGLAWLAACDQPGAGDQTAVLTITGAVANTNRGAVDPALDRFFVRLGADFSGARSFVRADLARLPQYAINIRTGPLPVGRYEGPLLADLLDLSGADRQATTLTVQGLDGYAAVMPLAAVRGQDPAILALSRNGAPLGLGGLGPAALVFEDGTRANDDWYVWGAVLVTVSP